MPTPRPFQAPVGVSPIFNWETLGLPSSKAQAARDAAASAQQLRNLGKGTPPPRMAGIFKRPNIPKVALPIVGTALNALDASLQLQEGRSPEQVAVNLGASELGGVLGAGVGSIFGPPGTVVGGVLGAAGADALTRDLKSVDARDIDLTDPETLRIFNEYRTRGLTGPGFEPDIRMFEAIRASQEATQGLDRDLKPFWQRTQAGVSQENGSVPPAPPQDRPVEERRPPVSVKVPPTSTPSPEERTQENDLARFYVEAHMRGSEMAQGGELQRRLWESGEMRGMTPESFMSWVEANPGLAYREAYRRGLLPEYETDSFK